VGTLPAGGTLERADDVTGPWFPLFGAASPYTFTPGRQAFYRVRYP
jgi:hypothetical protein